MFLSYIIFVFLLYESNVYAYLETSFEPLFNPSILDISDDCTLYSNQTLTVLHFHNGNIITSPLVSEIHAINNRCDLVLFGYPDENKVILWKPMQDYTATIQPNFNVQVDRFGFSLDVQNQSWVVGAPGTPNDNTGNGATMGYAFVYENENLHSCRSLYDTYCYPVGTECVTGFKNMKDYYKLNDSSTPAFQKKCMEPQLPYYSTGPLDPVRVPYFEYEQFGYSVVLSGQLGEFGSALFISAPGDTNRFMEDNAGANYGRVYMWDSFLWDPQDESLETITWWKASVYTPLEPPNLPGVTYRAYGRAMAASRATLAVSTYPLYDNTREPFVIIYDCSPEKTTYSHCKESTERGISIDDLPGNVLGYMTNEMLAYTDGKTRWSYIPVDVDTDNLNDFQNNFIGKVIGVTGSNVIIPDPINKKVYRFGKNTLKRETHPYLSKTHDIVIV